MATRSAIGYLQPSGSVRAVYCHWDGYPEHQLPILTKRYSSTRKVQALIRPGSMSSLRTRKVWDDDSEYLQDAVGDPLRDIEGFLMTKNDRAPQPLYHHERVAMGEGYAQKPITSNNALHTWFTEHDCEYLYVFDGQKWITYSEH